MFLQAVEILKIYRKLTLKNYLTGILLMRTALPSVAMATKKKATQKNPCVGQLYLDQGITLLCCQKNEGRR